MRIHLKNCCIFPLRVVVSCLLSYYLLLVAVCLVVQGRMQLECNSHILLKEVTKGTKPIWKAHLELNGIALSNSIARKCTPMQVKKQPEHGRTSVTKEQKMILLSDELWLIVNNSKSFANRSMLIIRNNLGLCKHSEIYLTSKFRTFKNIIMDLMV